MTKKRGVDFFVIEDSFVGVVPSKLSALTN